MGIVTDWMLMFSAVVVGLWFFENVINTGDE